MDPHFTYESLLHNHTTEEHTIDVRTTCLYLVDLDLAEYIPELDTEIRECCKIKEMLPRGQWDLNRNVPDRQLPPMGPNLFVGPCGTETRFHTDMFGFCSK